MGQILSSICGEKFDTSLSTPSHSNDGYDSENEVDIDSYLRPWNGKGGDDSDEEENPLILKSSIGLVFQILLEIAAKKVVEDFSKNYESIVEKKEIVKDDCCGLGNEAGIETSTGPVFQVHTDPVAKKGNGKPLADQKNKQRKVVDIHKNVAINNPLTLIWKKKETVEEGNKNEAILIKSSNVTKKKEIVEDLCKNESIIKSLNATKKKRDDEKNVIFQSRRAVYRICIKPSANKVDEDGSKNCESVIEKNLIVEDDDDDSRDDYILGNEAAIQTGSVFQVSSKPVEIEKKGNADNLLTDHRNKQRKEVYHHKDVPINKKWKKAVKDSSNNEKIVEDDISIQASLLLLKEDKDKPMIFQSSRGAIFPVVAESVAKKGNGKQDQSNKQIKEVSHHKDVAINKRKGKKKKRKNKTVDKEKPLIFESSSGPVFQVKIKSALKDENGKPLTNQSKAVDNNNNNKTINKACTSMWKKKKIVEDVNFKEPITRKGNDKPLIVEEGKHEIFQSLKKSDAEMINNKPPVDFSNKQIKETIHHNETINIALIVKKEKPLIIQSLVKPAAKKVPLINNVSIVEEEKPVIFEALDVNKPLADFSYGNTKETNRHHKIDFINNEIIWLKHYNNKQKILMVGEGDFSFSASLAVAFGSSASNITATSFNNSEYLRLSYKNATKNIEKLRNRGATVRHGVDATKMSIYSYWKGIKFDRIIYNFPYSGCPKSESRQTQMRQHLELVRGFLVNAKEMLEEKGEIHISHKTNGFHSDWKLKELGFLNGLLLVEEVKFDKRDYPGYETKQGYNGDNNFDCYPSSTYMFVSIENWCG